ncbi:MAG: hypothetical protein Q8916_11705 [Bacteroidota bacterium]|nr:hypothetical protein [Bacteroidota bacterium]MDP4234855.1 hypothetical protein [Bacteroidota bacterium]
MLSKRNQIIIWICLFIFWVAFSRNYHPALFIDVVVTLILLSGYAFVVYVNILALIPRFWRQKRLLKYWLALLSSMLLTTLVILALVRLVYSSFSDPARIGDYWEHFAIDFFGMAVHVFAAVCFVRIIRFLRERKIKVPPGGEEEGVLQ